VGERVTSLLGVGAREKGQFGVSPLTSGKRKWKWREGILQLSSEGGSCERDCERVGKSDLRK
jgi:hypothetical protein